MSSRRIFYGYSLSALSGCRMSALHTRPSALRPPMPPLHGLVLLRKTKFTVHIIYIYIIRKYVCMCAHTFPLIFTPVFGESSLSPVWERDNGTRWQTYARLRHRGNLPESITPGTCKYNPVMFEFRHSYSRLCATGDGERQMCKVPLVSLEPRLTYLCKRVNLEECNILYLKNTHGHVSIFSLIF